MDEIHHLKMRLSTEADKILNFFKELTPEQWEKEIYLDGSHWRVKQILAHLVSTEEAIIELVNDVLMGGAGAPEDFDINAFNERRSVEMSNFTIPVLLEQFTQKRQSSILLVSRMTPADLTRLGRHPFLGMVTLGEIIRLLYLHSQIHLRDIRRVLASDSSAVGA